MPSQQKPKDIVVVGAGIIGVSTAYFLSQHPTFDAKSTTITILDGSEVAAGASGKAGGLLALDWHGPPTASLAELSYGLHESLAKQYDGANKWGYRQLDTLSVQTNTKGPRRKAMVPSEIDWLDNSIIEKVGVLGTTSTTAQVHPRKFCHTLLSEAEKVGVQFKLGHVTAIKESAVEYEDESGNASSIPSDCTIVAAGPWTSTLIKAPISATRAHSITIKTTEPVTPHALFTEMTLKSGKHVSPEIYARSDEVYVCGEGDEVEPLPRKASQVKVVESRCDILKQYVDELSPVLKNGEIGVKQACYLPTVTRGSGGPLIGKITDNLYVAAGHSCWGICLGPGTGKVMSELIMDGKVQSADISYLNPQNLL
ncbi:UPF0673 membrane protein C1F5.03c [Taphrina deformans PYCC 5710]|uniref:UPF0673 membrane protein C1F5.03c n=1 Tax=Taphrina deformans (strain PYCC 5710 / ATCC 11124 / CBS 356.35 / IMI 108563 / JCM 9778 / NBRC 8474) TaxID=1097556 RepID=R4X745_TAPDE|nr:UPF0673 membrane protein C1F5.03c [Taphrina deformans PYCC 5710]|eukprot:CCG81102.1 UPF0673 membrane protein C1F5.03c [Taphrina deformans PYCC 5710]